MTYEGWTNYATWNIILWMDNEYPLYRAKMNWLRGRWSEVTANQVEAFIRDLLPDGTPDFDKENNYAHVNWEEVAELWDEERTESER